MSGEILTRKLIEGYVITITNQNTEEGDVIFEQGLEISKLGGAHIINPKDLIMMIEDAVFVEELK